MSKAAQKIIRLLIIDDHTLFRESVSRLLQSEPGFEVVGDSGSVNEALQIIKSSAEIDVVLLDLDLGQERGTDFMDQLRRTNFSGKCCS
jgi:two-component system nitrate/nitrite response regulator NarL